MSYCKDHRTKQRLYRQRWDKADLLLYYAATGAHLQSVYVPSHLLHDNANSEAEIENYYGDSVRALVEMLEC